MSLNAHFVDKVQLRCLPEDAVLLFLVTLEKRLHILLVQHYERIVYLPRINGRSPRNIVLLSSDRYFGDFPVLLSRDQAYRNTNLAFNLCTKWDLRQAYSR